MFDPFFYLAVQKERDRLGRPRNSHHVHGAPTIKTSPRIPGELDDNDDDDDLSVMALLKAERTAQEVSILMMNMIKNCC